MTRHWRLPLRATAAWALAAVLVVPVHAERPPKAAVATAHPLATEVGHEILEEGGNAFDAAVAVSAALAVVEPAGSGLGGGGFWLLHRERDGHQVMVDGRERAPLGAHRDLFLDEDGEFDSDLSLDTGLAAGIPGTPAALAHLTEEYGRLSLAENLAPAAELAREGFEVTEGYRRLAEFREVLAEDEEARSIFLDDGEVPEVGDVIRQPDLAETLERLGEDGRAGFYRGEIAQALVEAVNKQGGIWTLRDLVRYDVVEREPVRGEYGEWRIVSAPPPSSGGVALVTMFNILARHELAELDRADRVHLLTEVMRRAYRDRAEFLGDPDYYPVPVTKLTHPWYAAALDNTISMERATPSEHLPGVRAKGENTTHFSVLDDAGNRVSATLSINYPFGAGFVAPGTGVLLNNEMDDFAAQPGEPNAYGLVGGEANAVEAGKRPLSSMSPTFVEGADGMAILGTPGGSRIITAVLLAALQYTEGAGAKALVEAPRFHHQYLPDRIEHEPDALDGAVVRELEDRGHRVEAMDRAYGDMQVIVWDRAEGQIEAASDPRGEGAARVAE